MPCGRLLARTPDRQRQCCPPPTPAAEAGSWRLEAGGWRLEAGGRRFARRSLERANFQGQLTVFTRICIFQESPCAMPRVPIGIRPPCLIHGAHVNRKMWIDLFILIYLFLVFGCEWGCWDPFHECNRFLLLLLLLLKFESEFESFFFLVS